MKKIILSVAGCFVGILAIIVLSFVLSDYPGALVIRKFFDHPVTIRDEKRYKNAQGHTRSKLNLNYPSTYQQNTFDFYYPKEVDKPLPVVLWVHGGGYVGGDKRDVREFATYLANEAHVAVLALNYELAPESRYPGQLNQLSEWIQYLQKKTFKDSDQLDFNQIFIGGDSAGAQIAVQYTSIQTNPAYAKQTGRTPDLSPQQIKGVLSYCGPLNLQQIAHQSSADKSFFERFFVSSIARSLLTERHWQTSNELKEATNTLWVNADFPPTYVTDGNAFSFSEQGKAFVQVLNEKKIPNQSLFFSNSKKKIPHEYQFHYDTPEAKQCLSETITFIQSYTQKKETV